ncbi:MAG: DUF420 domain-containing protein [Bacteroidota bacterium]
MQNPSVKYNPKVYVPLIWSLSIAVPLVVGILLNPRLGIKVDFGFNALIFSDIIAVINSVVSVLLVAGIYFIKQKNIKAHRTVMLTAFGLSALFLVFYILYHLAVGHRVYCDEGLVSSTVYYTILISHIGLSVFIIPLASFSIFRALSETYDRHRKIAKITFPLWLYVSISGVLVYFFISPCSF